MHRVLTVRKWILALVGLLVLVGECHAAYFQGQTYLPSAPARTQKNLVSDYGAACNAQTGTKVVTITNPGSGLNALEVSTSTFQSGDTGKTILIPGAGAGGSVYAGTMTFVDATHATLSPNASTALSSSSQYITWGNDDTSAFLAFKAAFQGSTPVQLNLPGNCSYAGAGDPNRWMFDGIADVIVAGNGTATSAITSLTAGGTLFLGTRAQYADSNHSVRTDTANAGDSCIILKTTPAVTVSGVSNSLAATANFTGSISGATLTASSVTGTIVVGAYIGNANSNVSGYTSIVSQSTGTPGGAGTYVVSISQSVASQAFRTWPASFTATVDAAGVMTVSAVADGALAVGMFIYRELGNLGHPSSNSNPTTIKSQLTGSAGGTGTYQLSNAPLASQVSSLATPSGFIGNGAIRVVLNSTTGLSTGDTLFLTSLVGTGELPKRMNGLQWVKVVNGTQIDLFQRDFNGAYTSGGTGGGDRTSLFPVGAKVLMTGWNNQSYWATPYSQPTNPHWFEYKTVVSNNSGTHQVCFDTALANTYKANWPQMNTGSQFEMDPGGPATLYVYPTSWDATIVIKDLTIDAAYGQSYSQGRNITFQNTVMVGIHCPVPTQNETYSWINVDGTNCSIETDKIVGTWNIINSTARKITVQSSSFDTINVSGSTIRTWAGSPKRLNIDSTSFPCSGCTAGDNALQVGTAAYGASDESICTNCNISTGLFGTSVPGQQVDNPNLPWSMSGGVITIPNGYSWNGCCGESELQTRGLVPGHYFVWKGSGGGAGNPTVTAQSGRVSKVIDVTQDLDNTYVQTSDAGGFPTGLWTTVGLQVTPHPAPKLTVSFVGTPPNSALVFNGCPAQAPIFSCQNFTYTGGATGTSPGPSITLWGVLDTFTVTNNVPYTNTGALSWQPNQFNQWRVLKTDNTQVTFGTAPNGTFSINTKLPSSGGGGTRTLTASGATGTQTLDALTPPPTDAWFGVSTGPIFTANTPSDSPQVTIQFRTNQQLPFLLKRDLDPASNDNDPMWTNKAA